LTREKVLAAVVKLLEVSLIRVGNEEYARKNDSFGLTTMRDQHVAVRQGCLTFRFRGKSGVWHEVGIKDQRLALIVKQCQDLPGQELFQYVDDDGDLQKIGSSDVNDYLRQISGHEFTAKDFRTWAGTVLAAVALAELGRFETRKEARQQMLRAVESVAQRLGNTPSVCRKCYVHPEVFGAFTDGTLLQVLRRKAESELVESAGRLPAREAAVLGLLQQRLKTAGSLQDWQKSLTRERKKCPRSGG
jgi:DNA topoisomerase-1